MTGKPEVKLYSTMGAALSTDEANTILACWFRLGAAVEDIAIIDLDDQVNMLDAAANIVGLISELRTAIYNGWHSANARALGPQKSRKVNLSNLSKEDLDKVLDYINQLEESP